MTAIQIRQLDAQGLYAHRDELIEVYRDAYADKIENQFFAEGRFWERLEAYAQRPGFGLVMAYDAGDDLVGYALGYPLPADSRWWHGLLADLDQELIAEDGTRTFALNYIMVRRDFRRRGVARELHNALKRSRPERRMTLLVLPDNVAAVLAYRAWGWQRIGELQPFRDGPTYDAMILDLGGVGT
ncbi:hypothetical protein GCM10009682_03080 [Luedemannella flava]|uniref:N-acetyltransferase domain-containing protein n=1 Tax=Luedemannella flava TaxID=349316 RepID=A0ABN2LCW6_9ACTN